MKELDLSWCHGFTNTGLLAFATYLNAAHAQYSTNRVNHYGNGNDDVYDNYVHHSYNNSHHNYYIYPSNNDDSNNNNNNRDNINENQYDDDNNVHNNNNSNSITTTTTIVPQQKQHQQQQVPCCLEKLSIEWCSQITNEAMNMISNILSLKSIHITGCCGITEEGLICLKRNGIDIC